MLSQTAEKLALPGTLFFVPGCRAKIVRDYTEGCFSIPLPVRRLQRTNVLSLGAFGAFPDFKLHVLAFPQALESIRLDGREMHEDVGSAVLRGDESKPFGIVKPLHSSLFHIAFSTLYFRISCREDPL